MHYENHQTESEVMTVVCIDCGKPRTDTSTRCRLCYVARVDPTVEQVPRRFPIYGTGHEISARDVNLPLVGTVFMGDLVFHVFNAGETSEVASGCS